MKATLKSNQNEQSYRVSWAEQMFLNKLAEYHYTTHQRTFEVEKETEKAVQLKVNTNDLFNAKFDSDYTGDKEYWFIWMPKSAVELA